MFAAGRVIGGAGSGGLYRPEATKLELRPVANQWDTCIVNGDSLSCSRGAPPASGVSHRRICTANIDELPIFKAGDGRDVSLLPGWFEKILNLGWPYGIKDFKKFVETCIEQPDAGVAYPVNPLLFLNKLVTANTIKCILEEIGYQFDGSARLLDICTGPAILPRAIKALGLCREAHGIDIQDRHKTSIPTMSF